MIETERVDALHVRGIHDGQEIVVNGDLYSHADIFHYQSDDRWPAHSSRAREFTKGWRLATGENERTGEGYNSSDMSRLSWRSTGYRCATILMFANITPTEAQMRSVYRNLVERNGFELGFQAVPYDPADWLE